MDEESKPGYDPEEINRRAGFRLDSWQHQAMQEDGDLCIMAGRQSGKSQIVAIKVAEKMASTPKVQFMVVSLTEDQAVLMLQKIALYLTANYPNLISSGAWERPSKHKIMLRNGAQVITKALGTHGFGIMGSTLDYLVADEADYYPDEVWAAITPTLLTSNGKLWMLSTLHSKRGYFYRAYSLPELGFKVFTVNSEEVAKMRPEPMRSRMLAFLEREKATMTDKEYRQQYLCEVFDEQTLLFSDELIQRCQSAGRLFLENSVSINPAASYYMGVDVARLGGDEITYEIFERRDDDYLIHIESIVETCKKINQTYAKIQQLNEKYNFERIYIDEGGGLGSALCDMLVLDDNLKRKVVAINNASKPFDRDSKRTRKILKEDLYLNLLRLMETNRISLLPANNIALSLRSMIIEEMKESRNIRIYGRYSHIAEGIIRAAWCVREKPLNPWISIQ